MSQRFHHSRRLGVRHPASLLPFDAHNPGLVFLMAQPVTVDMVVYISRLASSVFNITGEEPYKADALPRRFDQYQQPMISLEHFICGIVQNSHVQTSTFLTTLIYLERLRSKLPNVSTGMHAPQFNATANDSLLRVRSAVHEAPCLSRHPHRRFEIPERLLAKERSLDRTHPRDVSSHRGESDGATTSLSPRLRPPL
jgi:hypothetical protein